MRTIREKWQTTLISGKANPTKIASAFAEKYLYIVRFVERKKRWKGTNKPQGYFTKIAELEKKSKSLIELRDSSAPVLDPSQLLGSCSLSRDAVQQGFHRSGKKFFKVKEKSGILF